MDEAEQLKDENLRIAIKLVRAVTGDLPEATQQEILILRSHLHCLQVRAEKERDEVVAKLASQSIAQGEAKEKVATVENAMQVLQTEKKDVVQQRDETKGHLKRMETLRKKLEVQVKSNEKELDMAKVALEEVGASSLSRDAPTRGIGSVRKPPGRARQQDGPIGLLPLPLSLPFASGLVTERPWLPLPRRDRSARNCWSAARSSKVPRTAQPGH